MINRKTLSVDDILISMCGNQSAVEFISLVYGIMHTWDDLIDKDTPVSETEINQMMIGSLFTLNKNQFYNQNISALMTLFESCVNDWIDSTELERRDCDNSKNMAFILRQNFTSLFIKCAELTGGYDHMRSVSMVFRDSIVNCETLEEYKKELLCQTQ